MESSALSPDELKKLQKEVRKAKRVATEWASQLHDLVEDRLPAGFEELPQISKSCFDACQLWKELSDRLEAAEGQGEAGVEVAGAAP